MLWTIIDWALGYTAASMLFGLYAGRFITNDRK